MTRWAPTIVVLLLLAGTAVAFATTERQKLEKTPFAVVELEEALSPVCRCATGGSTISLRFRRPHVLTVRILNGKGGVVRTLADEQKVAKGIATFRWNGRDEAGRPVPDAEYAPQFTLDEGRTFEPPNPIRVDSVAPTSSLVSFSPRVLTRRAKARIRIRYRVSEIAHPILYVNGRQEVLGGGKALLGKFDWRARRDSRRLRPGRYRLQLAAVDLAGNIGKRTPRFVVRVR